jgi:hypothetical protein
MEDLLYIGLELDDISRKRLLPLLDTDGIEDPDNIKIINHHMTIAFHTNIPDDIFNWCVYHRGEMIQMTAVKLGASEKAVAVQVDTDAPSTNTIKHITLAVDLSNGGKPVDSNYIKEWVSIDPIVLFGKVTFYYKNGRKW